MGSPYGKVTTKPRVTAHDVAEQLRPPQEMERVISAGRPRRTMPAGYSGTPLPKKLGLNASSRLVVIDGPADYEDDLLGGLPAGARRSRAIGAETNLVHLFVTERGALGAQLQALRSRLSPQAVVWVSWPKKASRVPTTVTEDTIRELALPLGYVDVKVCAVSEVWSGLKLLVRKELRA